MDINKSKVIKELDAFISQAWGEGNCEGSSIKMDPSLGRTLEWIRDCYSELYKNADESFTED